MHINHRGLCGTKGGLPVVFIMLGGCPRSTVQQMQPRLAYTYIHSDTSILKVTHKHTDTDIDTQTNRHTLTYTDTRSYAHMLTYAHRHAHYRHTDTYTYTQIYGSRTQPRTCITGRSNLFKVNGLFFQHMMHEPNRAF